MTARFTVVAALLDSGGLKVWTLIIAGSSSTLIAQEAPAAPARSPLEASPTGVQVGIDPFADAVERAVRAAPPLGPKPDAGSCTSLGARIDLVDDSRAYPTCPGRRSMCALSLTCTCEQKPLRAIPFPEDWLRMIMGVAASQGWCRTILVDQGLARTS